MSLRCPSLAEQEVELLEFEPKLDKVVMNLATALGPRSMLLSESLIDGFAIASTTRRKSIDTRFLNFSQFMIRMIFLAAT